jgi:NTP pyrophosphatase (non-canonical NTP hydrolase)
MEFVSELTNKLISSVTVFYENWDQEIDYLIPNIQDRIIAQRSVLMEELEEAMSAYRRAYGELPSDILRVEVLKELADVLFSAAYLTLLLLVAAEEDLAFDILRDKCKPLSSISKSTHFQSLNALMFNYELSLTQLATTLDNSQLVFVASKLISETLFVITNIPADFKYSIRGGQAWSDQYETVCVMWGKLHENELKNHETHYVDEKGKVRRRLRWA